MAESFMTEAPDAASPDSPKFKFGHPSLVQHGAAEVREMTVVVQEEDPASVKRRAVLIEQAESRAEQQALARVTMLDLARELEEASKSRREMWVLLQQERAEKDQLKAAADAAQQKLDEALQSAEDAKVAHMQDKLKAASLKGSSLSCAVMWSREAVGLDVMGEGMNDEEREWDLERQPDIEPSQTEAALQAEGGGGAWARLRQAKKAGKVGGSKWKPLQLAVAGQRSRGDGVTLRWIVLAWKEQALNSKLQKQQGGELLERNQYLEAEMKRMREAFEKKLEEERSKNRQLDSQRQALLEELERLKKKNEELEKEKIELIQQFCGGEGAENPFEVLKRKCAEMEKTIAEKNAEIAQLQNTIRELEAEMARQRAQFEEEKRKLKAQIRELSAELQRQIIFAKHLRDVALKAKRDASGAISPEKMAQLISDLEDMRDRLTWLGSEAEGQRAESNLLRLKLENNSRKHDLEKQFLPFLHKVQGPVGKHPLIQKKQQAQSMGALAVG